MTPDPSRVRAVLTVAFLAAGWLPLGWWLLRRVRATLLPSEGLALALLAGAGVEGVALFVVGQVRFSALVAAAVALAALLPLSSASERRALGATFRALGRPSALALAPLLAAFALLLVSSLRRPWGDTGNDAISYHLFGPLLWLRHGHVVVAPEACTTAFPAAIEALFGAAMSLGNERAPGLLGMCLGVVVVIQAYGLARWLGASARWAELTTVLVATVPPLMVYAPLAYVDVAYAGFALGAFRLVFDARTAGASAGPMFLGLALATKYHGLTLGAITLALGMARQASRGGWRVAARDAGRGLAVAGTLALPFLLRNLLVLGTPIYPPPPVLARLLPGHGYPYEASVRLQRYLALERGPGLGRGPLDFLLLPWRLTMHGAAFHGVGGVGLAPLAFFPPALLASWGPVLPWALAWLGGNAFVWFLLQQEARFLGAFVILATAIAARGAEALWVAFPRVARVAVAAVVLVSVGYGGMAVLSFHAGRALQTLSPQLEETRRAREIPFHDAFVFLNALPQPCRVLILSGVVPPYFLEKDYLKVRGAYFERPIPGVVDAATALTRLRELGVTHVLDVDAAALDVRFEIPAPPPAPLRLAFETPTARVFAVDPTR